MQISNSISCRKLDEASLNPFSGLFNNLLFFLINLLEIIVYHFWWLICKCLQIRRYVTYNNIICWIFAIGGIFVALIVGTLPSRWFKGINVFSEDAVDEENLDETLTIHFSVFKE